MTNVTYFQVMDLSIAADDTIDVNFCFKQFLIAVDSYAATNYLLPWMTFH